jgi:DNA gyrase subunit A
MGEVIDATIYRMDHPECTVPDLMEYIKGPDFPTQGIIYGLNGIIEAYTTGKGRVMVRARAEVEEDKHRIIVTEIPYQVNKSPLVEGIANLVKEKRIEGITDVRDESGKDGMRIVIEHRRDANGQIILNQLYKFTQLEDTCAINMLALVNNEPKILSLPQILDHYISHQESVIINRTKFELEKAKARAHIFEGYKIALDNIDAVVEIMKTSKSIPESKTRLMDSFGLSDIQAQAIVEMTLGRLTGLERQKIEDELARLHALIEELEGILADINKVRDIIKNEMLAIKEKYADERRTEIVAAENEIILEDLIERHACMITMTHTGYIKRQPVDTYSAQKRGGKGIIGMTTKEEDFIEHAVAVNSHSYLMLFTNTGKVHVRKAYMIPEASRTAKGTHIANLLELTENEKITAIISITDFAPDRYLTMVTCRGVIKRTLLSEYEIQRKGGKIALSLDEGDELMFVKCTDGNCDLVIASHDGSAIRFSEQNVRPMGRTARGVRGINLREGDTVAGVAVAEENKWLITVTENGYGKRTPFSDLRTMRNRGGMGVVCHNLTEKTGLLAGIATVDEQDDIMMITDQGTIVRTPVADINVYSRTASGVIVMRLSEGQKLVTFTKVAREDEAEKEAENLSETEEAVETVEVIETEQTEEIPEENE